MGLHQGCVHVQHDPPRPGLPGHLHPRETAGSGGQPRPDAASMRRTRRGESGHGRRVEFFEGPPRRRAGGHHFQHRLRLLQNLHRTGHRGGPQPERDRHVGEHLATVVSGDESGSGQGLGQAGAQPGGLGQQAQQRSPGRRDQPRRPTRQLQRPRPPRGASFQAPPAPQLTSTLDLLPQPGGCPTLHLEGAVPLDG